MLEAYNPQRCGHLLDNKYVHPENFSDSTDGLYHDFRTDCLTTVRAPAKPVMRIYVETLRLGEDPPEPLYRMWYLHPRYSMFKESSARTSAIAESCHR